jgi:hypothetical protein
MRGGWTLPEVLVSLALTGFVVLAAAGAVEAHRRALVRMTGWAVEDEALRVIRGVLTDELRGAYTGDHGTAGGDSVGLRAYRSSAIVCGFTIGSEWRVASRGLRRGDPEKDSVRILGADGRWRPGRLVRTGGRPGACADSSASEWWRVEPVQDVPPLLLRAFERGGYHLTSGTLRYRRGAGGRQPLTPELFGSAGSGLETVPRGIQLWLQSSGRDGRRHRILVNTGTEGAR